MEDSSTTATLHIANKLAVNVLLGATFIHENIFGTPRHSKKVLPGYSRPVSILAWVIIGADVNVSMANASEATPTKVTPL